MTRLCFCELFGGVAVFSLLALYRHQQPGEIDAALSQYAVNPLCSTIRPFIPRRTGEVIE